MWVCAAFILFNASLANVSRARLVWENKKLDEKYGTKAQDDVGEENEGTAFTYIL